jgi:hypothetical protein
MARRKLVNGKADFPVGDLPKGLYLMRVQGNAGMSTQKVAIE